MNAAVESQIESQAPMRRLHVTPLIELGVLALAVVVAVGTFFVLTGQGAPTRLLTPPLVALLLVANLVPGVALLVLFGRRVAMRRAARTPIGGNGQLHVRLVAIFSMVAAVPVVLVAIVSSLLFQYGVEFWSSGQARGLFDTARAVAVESFNESLRSVDKENVAMATDIYKMLYQNRWSFDDPRFVSTYGQDVYQRSLTQSLIFSVSDKGDLHSEVVFDLFTNDLVKQINPSDIKKLNNNVESIASINKEQIRSLTKVPDTRFYLFSTRAVGTRELLARMNKINAVNVDYKALQARSRSLQLQFNLALLLISLLIVAITVWIALKVADRLVAPVGELVDAARRVEGGDLSTRVADRATRDEIGTLSNAFNRMTERLESQNTALVVANAQLDSRRALIEAVMSGVSAGVVSIAEDRTIRLINSSAEALLGTGGGSSIGRPLAAIAPELDALLDQPARDAVVQMIVAGEARTLAVRIARDGTGPILTFDDITQQLLDQRRAAWSDVARRIAHEIKNPLTPIQLAAERLQRRYGKTIDPADTTFSRLTDTIVRQVGDLRRMVDEFSSFARMPKPSFEQELLVDIARQTLFLHEVAHPGIAFSLVHDNPGPTLVCDRRQMGQALTNIVKNAVEAIEATGETGGAVTMTLAELPGRITIEVADNGVGLPVERDRIVEPYMTTRARGTGLGLAIVKKIVEEHCGTIGFADRPEGGTVVCMVFDTQALAAIDTNDGVTAEHLSDGGQLAALTRNRT